MKFTVDMSRCTEVPAEILVGVEVALVGGKGSPGRGYWVFLLTLSCSPSAWLHVSLLESCIPVVRFPLKVVHVWMVFKSVFYYFYTSRDPRKRFVFT